MGGAAFFYHVATGPIVTQIYLHPLAQLYDAIFGSFQAVAIERLWCVCAVAGVDPNEDNFVSAGIINTRTTLIGCLL